MQDFSERLYSQIFNEIFWKGVTGHGLGDSQFLLVNCIFMQTVIFYVRKHLLLSAHLSHHNSVCPSVCHTGGSVRAVEARITKSSPSAAWKTLVSGTVKLFYKFKGSHPE